MDWLLERWASQACLIHGRRVREVVPTGKTAGDAMLIRWVDVEYSADDGGDVRPRYLPGAMPLVPTLDAETTHVEFVLGTLELSASVADGRNAFKRFEPYPPKLVAQQEREFAELARLFDEDFEQIALDAGPGWHLVAGPAKEAHLFFGSIVKPSSAEDLPEGVLQRLRGEAPEYRLHPRTVVGARIASVDAKTGYTLVDPRALDPSRYTTVVRVLRNFWPHAKPGFVVVPTARATDRSLYVEPEA